jgi:hypothetical protein
VQWVLQPIEAIRALGLRCSREELEVFLSRHDHELSAVALAVLDELLYMPGVAEAERESIPYGMYVFSAIWRLVVKFFAGVQILLVSKKRTR